MYIGKEKDKASEKQRPLIVIVNEHHTCSSCECICQMVYVGLQGIYTGCPRRNVPDFGRVFLMLKYTDITQNTYIQS